MCQNLFRSGLPGGYLGSKRGEEVPAAQNQVRGKPNTREVGQPSPLCRVCYPILQVISIPRTKFWAAAPFTPRMLPNSSFNKHPAGMILGSRPLFAAHAARQPATRTSCPVATNKNPAHSHLLPPTSPKTVLIYYPIG